jgi:hypothetical protein
LLKTPFLVRLTAVILIAAFSWATTAAGPAATTRLQAKDKAQVVSGSDQDKSKEEGLKPIAVAGKSSEAQAPRKKFPWLIVIGAAVAVGVVVAVLLLKKDKNEGQNTTECERESGAGVGDSDAALVARAENMLSMHEVTIADAQGDWLWTGFPEDNPSPYPVPFADLTGITFAVDADYLYVKIVANGRYPASAAERPWYGQDQITKLNTNIALDTDNNENTGSPGDKGAEVLLGAGMMVTPTCGWMDVYNFWYGPTGIGWPETARWTYNDNRNLVVAAWGGRGFNYRVIIFPARLLGVHPGQTIGVSAWDECDSLLFPDTHATLDPLGPGGIGCRVVIQLPM